MYPNCITVHLRVNAPQTWHQSAYQMTIYEQYANNTSIYLDEPRHLKNSKYVYVELVRFSKNGSI